MATNYARIRNQNKLKYRIIFSGSFHKINEEDQRSDEIGLFVSLNINNNLTESDIDNNDVKSRLEHQIQTQEPKESGWIFDKNNSMKTRFYETGELNDSSYVSIPLRSNALLSIENNDKFCF